MSLMMERKKMGKYSSAPVFNSGLGVIFYKALSDKIGKPGDIQTIAILNAIRLLIRLPEPICKAIISPLADLPLLIDHPDALVRLIVQLRLRENI